MVIPPSFMPSPSSGSYLSDEQTQLSGWALEASPLLISANLAALSGAELGALENPDMIAIDASGAQSAREVQQGFLEAFVKPADGGTAVFIVNAGSGPASMTYTAA
jgi:hypothetical protein